MNAIIDHPYIYHFWKRNTKSMTDSEVAKHFKIHSSTLSDILTKYLAAERYQRRVEKFTNKNVNDLTVKELCLARKSSNP